MKELDDKRPARGMARCVSLQHYTESDDGMRMAEQPPKENKTAANRKPVGFALCRSARFAVARRASLYQTVAILCRREKGGHRRILLCQRFL